MFQPQPTPFSTFFPNYLSVPVENIRNNGVPVEVRDDSYPQQAGFSSYHQTPFASLGGPMSLDPGPGPSGGSGGPSAGPDPVSGPGGLGNGGAQPTPAGVSAGGIGTPAPLSVFPLHGAIPHSQQPTPPGAPNLFDHKPPPNHNLQRLRQHFTPSLHSVSTTTEMEPNQSLQDDLAAQEAAARTWQPELQGPRVGEKAPINAITAEYAKADHVYVTKTMALPQTYTHYRPVKGDGNCGWRAIGFCYFELLIQQGSQELIQGEQLRLKQLNDFLVNSGGHDPDIFMDFVDETFQLFEDILDNIHSPDTAIAILTSRFNDEASLGILYHLRLLASSWLKGHRDQYEAWCETGIDGYCASMIEIPDREIEELGIVLLVEVLLKPVGFTLEIAYLDRSAGTEVNTHRFPESDANIGPHMHLLYRPGHYDILYKPAPTEIQVNRMSFEPTTFSSVPQFPGAYDFNPLAILPGAGTIGPLSPMGQLGGPSLDYSPSPQSPWFSSPYADSSPTPPSQPPPPQQAPTPTQPLPGPPMSSTQTHEIRFSRYQYEEGNLDTSSWPEQTFQTNMFKNSHFNKAHYNNPDFTPEEYKPDADDGTERGDRPGRKKSYGKVGSQSPDESSGHSSVKKDK